MALTPFYRQRSTWHQASGGKRDLWFDLQSILVLKVARMQMTFIKKSSWLMHNAPCLHFAVPITWLERTQHSLPEFSICGIQLDLAMGSNQVEITERRVIKW